MTLAQALRQAAAQGLARLDLAECRDADGQGPCRGVTTDQLDVVQIGQCVQTAREGAEVSETDAAYVVKLDLPEVSPADVKVSVKEQVLSIKGERKIAPAPVSAETAAPAAKIHLQERTYGNFSRSFSLPKNADSENVTADYKNGVLTVTILKRAEVKPKEIEVRIN